METWKRDTVKKQERERKRERERVLHLYAWENYFFSPLFFIIRQQYHKFCLYVVVIYLLFTMKNKRKTKNTGNQ